MTPLRVLQIHTAYQQRGGEDAVADDEAALLSAQGHAVERYLLHNHAIAGMGRLPLAARTLWSREAAAEVRRRCAAFRPDVIHVHNTFALASPSVYWAAQAAGVPVVQTLHNYRLLCPQAMFLRESRSCTDCLGHVPWRGVLRGCYRHSVAQSAVLATMLTTHRVLGTWRDQVTRYIALTEANRAVFVQGGLPADRIRVKPNFVDDPGEPDPAAPRQGVLFVGRLSPEKGLGVLLEAARQWPAGTLTVIGDGPLAADVAAAPGVRALGAQPPAAVREAMRAAQLLVLPSICHEQFPRTLVEAYAVGLPVVASDLGALAGLVLPGETGRLFPPADAQALARIVAQALGDAAQLRRWQVAARARYVQHYTPSQNHTELLAIYQEARAAQAASRP